MGNRIYKRILHEVEGATHVVIEYKDVKGLRMMWSDRYCMFRVSAPIGMPIEEIDKFLAHNLEWMHKVGYEAVKRSNREYEDMTNSAIDFEEVLRKAIARAESATGLRASQYTIKHMASRWGSSNTRTRRISINSRLGAYPPECTYYVVVHELCHFVHANHSADFWAMVERYCPDWRRHRETLR